MCYLSLDQLPTNHLNANRTVVVVAVVAAVIYFDILHAEFLLHPSHSFALILQQMAFMDLFRDLSANVSSTNF